MLKEFDLLHKKVCFCFFDPRRLATQKLSSRFWYLACLVLSAVPGSGDNLGASEAVPGASRNTLADLAVDVLTHVNVWFKKQCFYLLGSVPHSHFCRLILLFIP